MIIVVDRIATKQLENVPNDEPIAQQLGISYLNFDMMDPRQLKHEIDEGKAKKHGRNSGKTSDSKSAISATRSDVTLQKTGKIFTSKKE